MIKPPFFLNSIQWIHKLNKNCIFEKKNMKINEINKIEHRVAVLSGKGGVGKSTVAANLALAYAGQGLRTALLDADIWGPSIPILFGLENYRPEMTAIGEKQVVIPAEKFGIKILSIGFFIRPDQALIWRGPAASKALTQLFVDALWGEIDVMVIDMPPGTGDISITLCNDIKPTETVIVTTPQKLAVADAYKAGRMLTNENVKLPITGVIENMSWFTPVDHPNEKYTLFGSGGGQALACSLNTSLLAQIPFAQGMAESADEGKLLTYAQNAITIPIYHKLAFDILGENKEKQ